MQQMNRHFLVGVFWFRFSYIIVSTDLKFGITK
jgi:hypothetical protein